MGSRSGVQRHVLDRADTQMAVYTSSPYTSSPSSSHPIAQAPTFVLVHGIGTSHRYFARLHTVLDAIAHTVSCDLPGFGGLPKPGQIQTVESNARVLAAALDRLGLNSVVLVGHSMGAQVATELARVRPDLVSHLVLIGPVADPRQPGAVRHCLALARDILREPLAGNLLVFADYLRCGPRWFASQLPSMLGYRTDLALREVEVSTLVIRGGDDPIAQRAWCQQLVAAARDGTLLELPGNRHLVQYSATAETTAGIADFVRSRPGVDRESV